MASPFCSQEDRATWSGQVGSSQAAREAPGPCDLSLGEMGDTLEQGLAPWMDGTLGIEGRETEQKSHGTYQGVSQDLLHCQRWGSLYEVQGALDSGSRHNPASGLCHGPLLSALVTCWE